MDRRPSFRSASRSALITGSIAAAALGLGVAPALADAPVSVSSSSLVKDSQKVLGGNTAQVTQAIQSAETKSGYTLHTVFIDRFESPSDPSQWMTQTMQKSSLGKKDILLVIATEDRLVRVRVPNGSTLTSAEGDKIFQAVRSSLSGKANPTSADWAAAATAASQQVAGFSGTRTSTTNTTPASTGNDDGGGVALAGGALALAAGGAAVYAVSRSKRRKAAAGQSGQGQITSGSAPRGPVNPLEAKSTEELRALAGQDILIADEAIHAAEQEIEFARLQFGDEQVAPMQKAIAQAKQDMQEAYAHQQQLDDDIPDTEQQTRSWLIQIIGLAEQVKRRLGEQQEGFERLRSMEGDIDKILSGFESRSAAARAKLSQAQSLLETTASSYSQQAVLRISDNVKQAADRLDFVNGALQQAHGELQQGNRSQAVVLSRPLDDALKQAETLLEQISTTSQELTQLDARLDRALSDAKADAAQARAMAPTATVGQGELQAAHAALAETISIVEAERQRGSYDPIDLSERLDVARDRVSHAIAASSEAAQAKAEALKELDRTLERAQRRVDTARDFIETRRGAVGAQARTRLSEAMRTFDEALRLRGSDPVQALGLAQQSLRLADESLSLADQDINSFQPGGYGQPGYGSQPGYGGPFGGGYGQRSNGMGGAILGGVLLGGLLDNIFDGGGGFSGGGGFGGGDFGGGGGGFDIGGGGFDIGGGDFGGGDF